MSDNDSDRMLTLLNEILAEHPNAPRDLVRETFIAKSKEVQPLVDAALGRCFDEAWAFHWECVLDGPGAEAQWAADRAAQEANEWDAEFGDPGPCAH